MRCASLLLLLGTATLGLPNPAAAQDPVWLVSAEADFAVAPLAPTAERFEPGAALSLAVHGSVTDGVLLGARLRGGLLADGPAPADTTLADPGVGDFYALHLSLRLRPLAPVFDGPERGTGLFVEIGGGGSLTGGALRPSLEAGLGWGFAAGPIDLGPVVRWTTVFEVDSQLDDRPAHVILLGLELTFGDARAAAPAPEEAPDRDRDGLLDVDDSCPEQPEDVDGFADDDGCPDPDDDADTILDVHDACPRRAEDIDSWADDDGCPDPDNDGDGIPDVDDACPNEAEVINGVDDRDGCPDEGLIVMVDDRIVLEEQVLFEFGQSRVERRAIPVLRAIVDLYRQHPEWERMRIEGHTDVRGTPEYNLELSNHRASRVRQALVLGGIGADVIESVGYGETRPVADGDDEGSHRANRRVEFVVVAQRELSAAEQASEAQAAAREREAARGGEPGEEASP